MYRYAMGQSLEHSIKYLHTALSNIVARYNTVSTLTECSIGQH